MNIVRLESISKSFNKTLALDTITLNVTKGSVLGLLGPNGAGKTTLLRILTGILQPDSGNYYFNNTPVKKIAFRNIGYLPEERGLYKNMKVMEQLHFLGSLKDVKSKSLDEKIDYWLNKTGISTYKNHKVGELSKGNQQKVQLAATLLHEPELVILDEPLSGFDAINAEMAEGIITELRASGTTFILSTHHMESVESLCSHIALINQGQLVLEGEIEEIKSRYRKGTYILKGSGTLKQPAVSFKIVRHEPAGNIYYLSATNKSTANDIISEVSSSFSIHSFTEEETGIKDIFIKTIQNNT